MNQVLTEGKSFEMTFMNSKTGDLLVDIGRQFEKKVKSRRMQKDDVNSDILQ